MVEWGDIGGVLSLVSGTLVWGFQEPVGCDWNFQLFPIQTRDSLHLCLLFWSGSGDSQPLLGALGYPSWVLWDLPTFVAPATERPPVLSTNSLSVVFYKVIRPFSSEPSVLGLSSFLFYWGNEKKIWNLSGGIVVFELIGLIGQK